jgi:FMN reductase (NADPH)
MIDFPPSLHAFAEHRSIRFFLPEPLAHGDLDLIVEAGRRAPTDAQGHMYAFVRITDRDLRDSLATLCANQQHIRDAAEFFVVCLDVHRLRLLVELRGGEWGMQERIALIYGATDATMVAQNMLVAAETLGYGTCYIGAVQNNTDRIAQELALPPGVLPLYGFCIGVIDPQHLPPLHPRIPRSLCFFDNRYPAGFTGEQLESAYTAMSAKRDWYARIETYFAAGGTMQKREPVMARAWRQQGLEPKPPQESR